MKTTRPFKKLTKLFSLKGNRKSPTNEEPSSVFKGCGEPSVMHATLVIFFEFFAWGLMTTPTLIAVKAAFPTNTFLLNGIIQGVKGILAFLCAPLIGALSDAWGRKSFLLLAVFVTCLPIPVNLIDSLAYFLAVAMSGIGAVTFSVTFSYVADCTTEENRTFSYGLVSATFAASLIISPSLGNAIIDYTENGERNVVILATVVSILNLLFIVFCVPESLPETVRKASWGSTISWEQADPFASLRKVGQSPGLLTICAVVLLSYLPEAGQYSCFFLYLKQVVHFSNEEVAIFIAVLCILSVVAQTMVLTSLMQYFGYKMSIIIGLTFQLIQLTMYGIYTSKVVMGVAGILAAMSTITYPAVSALVSKNAEADQQGVALGILTGIRGLCMGLGPALYGILFYMFHVDLGDKTPTNQTMSQLSQKIPTLPRAPDNQHLHGVPFLTGAALVFIAIWVALSLKSDKNTKLDRKSSSLQLQPLTDDHKSPGPHYIDTRYRIGGEPEVTVSFSNQSL